MKRQQIIKSSLGVWLLLLSMVAHAGNVEKYFVTTPQTVLPLLSQKQRIELLEYYKDDKGDSIENRFRKQSRMLLFDTQNQYLKLQTTPSTTFELFILQPDTVTPPVIGIIRTVCAPVCHSSVTFYDSVWQTVPTPFDIPKATAWVDTDALTENEDVAFLMQPFASVNFISLQYDAENATFTAFNNNLDYLNTEEREKISPFVKQEGIKIKTF